MSNLYFAEPQWLHLIWPVIAFVVILLWLEQRSGNALSRFISTALQAKLVKSPSPARRWLRVLFLFLAGCCLTLAMMRPQWGVQFVSSPRVGAEIMVALDISRSMLAEDVTPNRLERAKAELRDLLTYLDGDKVGLIAFAGRATVLSPLTPDFGFLRLVLDSAGPHSVTRGGTRLEEPIRKAVAGFAQSGDVAQSIILITDGEDHDSFPLEAAKAAAERGIRILAIGFGDEAGSEIIITDPKTGARGPLRDADGNLVTSRLDGDILREIALLTEGAYIPAGTGVLDLESIYQRHIANLTRASLDSGSRTVRNDAFQWAVLLALLFLLAAVLSTSSRGDESSQGRLASWLLLACLYAFSSSYWLSPALAQNNDEQENTPTESKLSIPADARAAYNQGLGYFQANDNDKAEQFFVGARNQAATDTEVRFRATYNLGWVEVKRADISLESQPEQALTALQRAADWFREAVALRPSDEDSRYNLEIVLRRALSLADSLKQQDERDLLTQLNDSIEAQRNYLDELRNGVNLLAARDDPNVVQQSRRAFGELAARQLQLLADTEDLSATATQELDTLKDKAESEQTAEERIRVVQLEQLLQYMHRAREHMGQTRGQLRRLQAERAYRRAAGALTALKRARDQLSDPVARLDNLLSDGLELARLSSAKAALEQGLSDMQHNATPAWLTLDYLAESQQSLEQRTGELHEGLQAGLTQAGAGETQQKNPEQQQFLQQLRKAEPMIGNARITMQEVLTKLADEEIALTLPLQQQILSQLSAAREQFLDLRRLIDLTYQEQLNVQELITVKEQQSEQDILEYLPLAAEQQEKNRLRSARIGTLVANQTSTTLEQLDAAQQTEDGEEKTAAVNAAQAELQHLEQIDQLQLQVQQSMGRAKETLQETLQETLEALTKADDTSRLEAARPVVADAVEQITQLRRLFFSVIEHLQETTQRQIELGDETETIAALADDSNNDETMTKAGPLAPRQQELTTMADTISTALQEQAQALSQAPQSTQQPGTQTTPPPPDPETIAKMQQAAEHVTSAKTHMSSAVRELGATPPTLAPAREQQNKAVAELMQALALLQPPQEQQQQEQQQQQQQQEQEQEQQQQQATQQEEDQQQQEADLNQLLQGIRDREAQRRQEQENRQQQTQGYEPVEKDW